MPASTPIFIETALNPLRVFIRWVLYLYTIYISAAEKRMIKAAIKKLERNDVMDADESE
jgi:hypothetical protein